MQAINPRAQEEEETTMVGVSIEPKVDDAKIDIEEANPASDSNDDQEEFPVAKEDEDDASPSKIFLAIKVLLLVGLAAFSITAFAKNFERAKPLFYIELVVGITYFMLMAVRGPLAPAYNGMVTGLENLINKIENNRVAGAIFGLVVLALFGIAIGVSVKDAQQLVSLVGLAFFVLASYLGSWKRKSVKWRPVIGGLLFQGIFAILILGSDAGEALFKEMGNQIEVLLKYTEVGSGFLFGYLVKGLPRFMVYPDYPKNWNFDIDGTSIPLDPLSFNDLNQTSNFRGPFAFTVLPTVIFFSSLVSVLYYLGVLQAVVRVIGRFLAFLLGTSASESLNAAGNIFIGQTEAPLLIKPFLKDMTNSEIHAVMTGGFATIAGGVMALYIIFGVDSAHLIAASVMSAPAALAISKLIYPETEVSKTAAGGDYKIDAGEDGNIIEAAANGASTAISLALNIGAQLIAFLALIAMIDAWLGAAGALVDVEGLSFKLICSYVFYPIAIVMGVPTADALEVGSLIGTKIFVNEFVAYEGLVKLIKAGDISKRAEIIATYALCGFSNFGSIGIQLGGLTPLAPNLKSRLAKLVFSAMVAGNIACFMTACVAGVLYDPTK